MSHWCSTDAAGRSLHLNDVLIHHCITSLLHWTHIDLFHRYLSRIGRCLGRHLHHIFDRHASLKPVWFNKVICKSPNFKQLIPVMTSAPRALRGRYAPCMLSHLTPFPGYFCPVLHKVLTRSRLPSVMKTKRDDCNDCLFSCLCWTKLLFSLSAYAKDTEKKGSEHKNRDVKSSQMGYYYSKRNCFMSYHRWISSHTLFGSS